MGRLSSFVTAILLGCHSVSAIALNYFVDANVGNDAFTGTSAVAPGGASTVGPWRTLTKVNAAPLQAGDAVYFRCGQSWRGTLRVASSSDPARPVKYSRFGSDCTDSNKPTITAAAAVTGWQPYSGQIYVANTWFPVTQLFADGKALRLAQYPNPDYQAQPSARGMMVTDQNPAPADYFKNIVDTELAAIADKDLVGAGLHVRVNDFIISDRVVAAFDPVTSQITLSQKTEKPILRNWGYYLDNKLWMLDEPGEFFFDGSDPAQMKVYVWMPDGGAPESRVVGSTNAYGIDATGATNATIEAMRVDKTGAGIAVSSSVNVVVRTCEVSDSYWQGIVANAARDGTIDNCSVRRSVREGILAGTATNFRILNNTVVDSGVVGSPVQSRGAISSTGTGVAIKNNYVANSGYHGIAFGKSADIANNRIENVCLVLNDCGGLYTGNGSLNGPLPHKSTVVSNSISGVYGNRNGRDPVPVYTLATGIYLDYKTSEVYVAGNTVSKTDMGVIAHAAQTNVFIDNTFYDYKTYAIFIKEYTFARITSPNRIERNGFFGLRSGPPIMIMAVDEDTSRFATWNANRYSALYAENPAILEIAKIALFINSTYSERFRNLQQWQEAGNDTSATVFDDFSIAPFAYQPVTGVNLIENGSFGIDAAGWLAYAAQGDATLAWRTSCPAPGCVALTTGALSPSGSLVSAAFPVGAGKSYVLRFSHRSGQQGFTSTIVPRMAGPSTYNPFQGWFAVTSLASWQSHSILFQVAPDLVLQAGDRGGRVDFAVPPNQTLYLDNVRVEEVVSTTNTPEDDSILLVNPTGYAATFNCPDLVEAPEKCAEYVFFQDGSLVNWPVTVGGRASSIVIWAGNPFRRQ